MQQDPISFFDAHTHLHFPAYDVDREAVFERARTASVSMIIVGTQAETSRGAVEFARLHDGVWAAIGLHPTHVAGSGYHDAQELGVGGAVSSLIEQGEEFDFEYYRILAQDSKVVAVGECGLDYFRLPEDSKDAQKQIFLSQIDLSRSVKKPLMIHCRDAFADLIHILQSAQHNLYPGVIHFFTGTKDDAARLLDLGFSFTFGGVITFTRDYDEVIRFIPNDRILSETDAPYVAPVPYRGRRNEPTYVVETVKKLAELKNVSVEEMAMHIRDNVRRIFGV